MSERWPMCLITIALLLVVWVVFEMSFSNQTEAYADEQSAYAYDTNEFSPTGRNWSPYVEPPRASEPAQSTYYNDYYAEPEPQSYAPVAVEQPEIVDLSTGD